MNSAQISSKEEPVESPGQMPSEFRENTKGEIKMRRSEPVLVFLIDASQDSYRGYSLESSSNGLYAVLQEVCDKLLQKPGAKS